MGLNDTNKREILVSGLVEVPVNVSLNEFIDRMCEWAKESGFSLGISFKENKSGDV